MKQTSDAVLTGYGQGYYDKYAKPVTPAPKKLYRIQVGAFPVKANVDALLAKVKAVGFNIANKEHKTRDCDYSLSWVFFAFRGQRFAMFPHTSAKLTAFIDTMKQNLRPLHSFKIIGCFGR